MLFLLPLLACGLVRAYPLNAQIVGRDVDLRDAYDYVVVGGGTAGLTLADRLTEDPKGRYF